MPERLLHRTAPTDPCFCIPDRKRPWEWGDYESAFNVADIHQWIVVAYDMPEMHARQGPLPRVDDLVHEVQEISARLQRASDAIETTLAQLKKNRSDIDKTKAEIREIRRGMAA